MSYCRFSSEDFQSNVYVYESCHGGWQCHVAARKHVLKEPLPPEVPFDQDHMDEWLQRHQTVMNAISAAEVVPLDLPRVDDFVTETPGEMAQRLLEMRVMGYMVPQHAIDALIEEQADMDMNKEE